MKRAICVGLAMLVCFTAIGSTAAHACQCGVPYFGSAWEIAKLQEENSPAIFEGVPERMEIQWNWPKQGELVPAWNFGFNPKSTPRMAVTFRVQRIYKGNFGSEAELRTGLGGGDCGSHFVVGMTYLVYAYAPAGGGLEVSMCSPGGLIGSAPVAIDLRYLRKERPTINDMAPIRRLTPAEDERESARLQNQRKRQYEEAQRKHAAVTGQICGTIAPEKVKEQEHAGLVSFLSTTGYSPIDHPMAMVSSDGSFCSDRLYPGSYYLYFARRSEGETSSAVYYPGVSERSQASTIEVSAGQTRSNVFFRVPEQKTYSVRGIISATEKSAFDGEGAVVALARFDGDSHPLWYVKSVPLGNSFLLPRIKYFEFDNVLPGRYTALVSLSDTGWYMKEVEVNVPSHMTFVSLLLVRGN